MLNPWQLSQLESKVTKQLICGVGQVSLHEIEGGKGGGVGEVKQEDKQGEESMVSNAILS